MSALPTRSYRVFFHTWDVYDATMEASSSEEALAKAEALYNAEGLDAFSHHAGDNEGFQIEENA
jgi:hypothetical protein